MDRKRPSSAQIDPTIISGLDPRGDAGATINTGASKPITKRMERVGGPVVRRLGYDEMGEIGRGGLGVVIEARQQAFDRSVALKRLISGDRANAMHFYAEAVISAQLEHPNIVPIHDLLADSQGRLTLVMKRMEGRAWKEVLLPGDDDAERAFAERFVLDDHLDILLKVCDAVSFAHSRGIIHRDLKPENVMIGDHGEVAVMDWGCALAFGEHEHHPIVPRVDEVERISGTPGYMSPEMVLLHPNRLGPCSDIYLLGGILYLLLTGTRPHRGADLHAVIRAAAIGEIVPPQQRAPQRTIPPELASIALAALDPDPGKRTASVQAFADAIRSYRRHAQALALADLARGRLGEAAASRSPTIIDDRLRRAVAAAENAVDLWPDWHDGRTLHAAACLAWAQHCLATGGHTQAQGLATQATVAARAAGDEAMVRNASALTQQARTAAAAARAHARNLRVARLAGLAAGGLVIIASVVGYIAVSRERNRTADALAQSERARLDVIAAQEARAAGQREAAPGMLAQARVALQADQLDEAARALAIATSFAPDLAEAQALAALVAVAQERWPDALAGARAWVKAAPTDQHADRLALICRAPHGAGPLHVEVRSQLSDLARSLGSFRLAGRWAVDAAARLSFYRAQLAPSWPDLADSLRLNDDMLSFAWDQPGLAGRKDIVDLAPIAGMPFSSLVLGRSGVMSLEPLHGMPLQYLDIVETSISDLSPLRGLPLQTLVAYTCPRLTDLSPLADCRQLVRLNLANTQGIHDITPLTGLPLEDLNLGSNPIRSMAPVRTLTRLRSLVVPKEATFTPADLDGLPLEHLSLGGRPGLDPGFLKSFRLKSLGMQGCALTDLALVDGLQLDSLDVRINRITSLVPLHGQPLTRLDLQNNPVTDLSPLRGMALIELNLSATAVTDLSPLAGAPVKSLQIADLPDLDLSVLAGMPLEFVRIGNLAGKPLRGIDVLRRHPTLKRVLGAYEDGEMSRDEWVRRYDAGQLR